MKLHDKAEVAVGVYQKHKVGDRIEDDDLIIAIRFFRIQVAFLHELGPEFHFTWKEFHYCLMELEGYAKNRKLHIEDTDNDI